MSKGSDIADSLDPEPKVIHPALQQQSLSMQIDSAAPPLQRRRKIIMKLCCNEMYTSVN
jgi:hypothetical protein